MDEIIKKINDVLDELRPFLINDGGNIEFVKFEDGKVYVEMQGACAGCELIDLTLKNGVEEAIKAEIPEVKEVVNISNEM